MKLLASDFDQTLLFESKMKIKDVESIKSFQKEGNLFGLCTGRSLKGVLEPSLPYQLTYDFYILLSGALILDRDFHVLYESLISYDLVKDIYTFNHQQDMSVVVNDERYKLYKKKIKDFGGIHIESFDDLNVSHVSALSFHYSIENIEQAKHDSEAINKKFGHVITAFHNNQHIDIAPIGCSKGEGIKIIRDHFHLKNEAVFGIGDTYNDLPMLNEVHTGFTFDYSPLEVQSKACHIVEHLSDAIHIINNEYSYDI